MNLKQENKIIRLHLKGYSYRHIADVMNKDGFVVSFATVGRRARAYEASKYLPVDNRT